MTFSEVDLACKGYETRMARVKEVPRVIAGILANVYKDGKAPIHIEKYIPLYTDRLHRVEKIKAEEYTEILRTFGRQAPTKEEKERLINRMKWQKTPS